MSHGEPRAELPSSHLQCSHSSPHHHFSKRSEVILYKFDMLDGVDPELRDRRNELFELSGLRGQYPQFFLVSDDSTVFWGDWE